MTSINTNASATTALRTLQATNMALEKSQNRVSTGLKIGEAKDNAAYWSISTTLRSDTKSLATVKDALSLGAATVDTAYQGLNKTIEVLDEIKSKITAASQDGVDKAAIQEEIAQLQKQLRSIAEASTFSGENFLAVNSGTSAYTATKQVVSGVSKDAAGNFTIETIDIDTSTFALTDTNVSGEAILDAGKVGNSLLGGLAAGTAATVGTQTSGVSNQGTAFGYTIGTGTDKTLETLALAITIDGNSYAFTLTDSNTFDTLDELVTQINSNIGSAGVASNNAGNLRITSATSDTTSTVDITTATFTGNGAPASTLAGVSSAAGGADETSTAGTATAAIVTQVATFGTSNVVLDDNDTITFQLTLNDEAEQTITISKETVSKALGTTNGSITTAAQYAAVLNQAFDDAGISDLTADVNGGAIRLTSSELGSDSQILVGSVVASKGTSVLNIDVSTASDVDLARFLNVVNKASEQVTTAASALGAVASRIDLQDTFVATLIDTIDKGISDLVDADLSEESTRLQALQTKQQLGIQALSIANSSTQNVLALFQ